MSIRLAHRTIHLHREEGDVGRRRPEGAGNALHFPRQTANATIMVKPAIERPEHGSSRLPLGCFPIPVYTSAFCIMSSGPSPDDASPDDDVTTWIRRIESGDDEAASELWQACFPRLLEYCRRRLPGHMRRVLDEEDVALSAFKSFCIGAQGQVLGDIHGRDELWKLLYCIAARKAHGYLRHQTRQKRGGGQVSGESIFLQSETDRRTGIDNIAGPDAIPVTTEQLASDCESLFAMLDDDMLQSIALLRMEGYSIDEISERVGCAKRSVERRLNLIRSIWKAEVGEV